MKIIVLSIIILSLILLVRAVFFFPNQKEYKVGEDFSGTITLLSEPRIRFQKQVIRSHGIEIQAPLVPALHYGDTLSVEGLIEESIFTAKNGEEVRLKVIKNPEITLKETHNPFINSTAFIRERVWGVFSTTLPRNEAGLLFGILFGGTQGIQVSMSDAFRSSGVLHVVAASGMNVTLISGFLFALTSRLLRRQYALIVSIFGIFYYALLAGFEPSILRASIMAGVAFTAAVAGRQAYAFLTLLLTAWIMVMLNPLVIIDVGFLLSFSSTVGIITVKPLFDSLRIFQKTKGFSDDLSTTFSAQIGSFPFMSTFFSAYSVISLVVNTLVLWTIPILMVIGGIAALLSLVTPVLAVLPLYICLPLLWYFEKVVLLFAGVPQFEIGNVPIYAWLGFYMILFVVILIRKKGKSRNAKGKSEIKNSKA